MVARRSPAAATLALAICSGIVCLALLLSCSSTGKKHEPVAVPVAGGMHGRALSAESDIWDFGTVKRGETLTHTVVLINSAAYPLRLKAHSSCDCLIAELEDSLISGESALELHVSFMGDVIKDKTTKTIQVWARDYPEEMMKITVTGRVTKGDGPHINLLPTILLFEEAGGVYEPVKLRVINGGRADLEVTEVRCFGCLASRSMLLLGEDEEIEMDVTLEEGWTQENRWMEIDSNDPVDGTKKVPLVVAE